MSNIYVRVIMSHHMVNYGISGLRNKND